MNAGRTFLLLLSLTSSLAFGQADSPDFDQKKAYRIVSGKTTRAEAEKLLGPAHVSALGMRGRTLVWEYRDPKVHKSVVLIIDDQGIVRDVRLKNAQSI
jgi:hypothetical protein